MSAGLVEATVRPGGDGIYCRLFMERERLEAPVSETPLPLALAWKGTRNLSALSPKRRGWHRPGLIHSHRPALCRSSRPDPLRRGWPLGLSATRHQNQGFSTALDRISRGTLQVPMPHTTPRQYQDSILMSFGWSPNAIS